MYTQLEYTSMPDDVAIELLKLNAVVKYTLPK